MNDESIYIYNHSAQVSYELQFGCTFCAQFDECISLGVSEAIFGEGFDRIIYQDKDFVVVPAIGQLVEGYLLIIPRLHFKSFAKLSTHLYQPFLILKNKLSDALFREYGVKPVFFEHGSNCDHLDGGACINHAHLHVVPYNINFIAHIPQSLDVVKIDNITALWSDNPTIDYPYLYFDCGDNEIYLVKATEYIPSQYFRRIIAAKEGIPGQWDWKQYVGKDKILKTIYRLRGKIS